MERLVSCACCSLLKDYLTILLSVQVYIKDVKSSNGTFINGERLSAEGNESDVFELHSEDIVVRLLRPPFTHSVHA